MKIKGTSGTSSISSTSSISGISSILVNNAIHVSLLFLFLTLFFYLYISNISKDAYDYEVNDIINKSDIYLSQFNKDPQNSVLLKLIPINKMINDVNKQTDSIKISNDWVKFNAISINILIPFILIFTLFVLYNTCNYSVNLYEIIIKNIILFIFIGIIEYIFFSQIASKYIVTSNNSLEKEIIQSIIDLSNN